MSEDSPLLMISYSSIEHTCNSEDKACDNHIPQFLSQVWSAYTGDRLLTLKSHTDGVTCLQFDDKVIVSGSYDRTVKLWDFSAC